MSAARKPVPAAPASQVRTVEPLSSLRARALRLLAMVPTEARALRDAADEHRAKPVEAGYGREAAAVERALADGIDARARELEADAEELAWYAAGCPVVERRSRV